MAVKCPMKEAGNGRGAAVPDWTLCFQSTLLVVKTKDGAVEVLTVLWASPLIFKQSVSSNLFSNDTLHYK